MAAAAIIREVNRRDEIVRREIKGATVEAVQRKIDRVEDAGRLIAVEAWETD